MVAEAVADIFTGVFTVIDFREGIHDVSGYDVLAVRYGYWHAFKAFTEQQIIEYV